MVNYCILNGVKSSSIKGLLIQSLPAISKPLMRTQIEEIDGRDGDIVTKLGYSAYEKEMSIGLFGDFNIDDIIQFFDSEGEVTFSNEPDKYYNYQIIEQIDFDRLLRYKTAVVKFHCQPFKYATVDRKFTLSNQFLDFDYFTKTTNGITLTADNGVITISGTGTAATEFYLPIKAVGLEAGDYTLTAEADGTNKSACSIRLINDVPSDAQSFGGRYYNLASDVSQDVTLTAAKEYDYLWFYITPAAVNFNLKVELIRTDLKQIQVINRGNTFSRPKVTLHGNGTIHLSLNGTQILVIELGNAGYITIDSAQMNAYQGQTFLNRYVTGNYEKLALKIGTNTISWTGTVTEIEVEDFSRWI